ncbi:MAG: nucleotidyltransferase domain-containing protein [Clostridia bacterium]|nr:nucleotidyltransferase domain-containing protein [Clostridia bacterium]
MVYSIDQIRTIIQPIAEKYNLRAVYLFGSYARGTAGEDSDIDLLVDTTGTTLTGLFALGELYCELEEALGKKIDLITVSSLRQRPQMPSDITFRDSVWNEKVDLYVAA